MVRNAKMCLQVTSAFELQGHEELMSRVHSLMPSTMMKKKIQDYVQAGQKRKPTWTQRIYGLQDIWQMDIWQTKYISRLIENDRKWSEIIKT